MNEITLAIITIILIILTITAFFEMPKFFLGMAVIYIVAKFFSGTDES